MILLLACGGKNPPTPNLVFSADALSSMESLAAPAPPPEARSEAHLVPVGRWIRAGEFVGYTYVDPEQGLSVQGKSPPVPENLQGMGEAPPTLIMRLAWRPPAMEEIPEPERLALGLPAEPEWLHHYGPQLPAGTLWGTWRLDPRLRPRFLPDYPDDLQVKIDDDPPHPKGWEVVWVRVTGCEADRCRGTLLNQPFHLTSVKQGDTLWFSADAPPDAYPVLLRL